MNNISGKVVLSPIAISEALNRAEFDRRVAIRGEIYELVIIKTRTGKMLLKGEITDGTDEIPFQKFYETEEYPNGFPLKQGDYAILEGNAIKNEYTKFEWSLDITGISIVDAPTIEEDSAQNKRIELQAFTQMSKMKSAMSVDKYFSFLAKKGYSHGIVTDLHSAQAFPSAYAAAKKHNIQMIFGSTFTLTDTNNKVVYGEVPDQNLKDITYIGFDIESTGLSVIHNEIIEIGAVKIRNGQVISRFQTFVKPEHPIPAHITELTGINQQMVDEEGVLVEDALRSFLEFIGEDVLVAHNATFDRDFLSAWCTKKGIKFGNHTIVDTLEIARSLDPDSSRGNRLNIVAKRYFKRIENLIKEIKSGELKEIQTKIKTSETLLKKTKKETPETEQARREVPLLKAEEAKVLSKIEDLKVRMKNLQLENHHRADEDSEVTTHILIEMVYQLEEMGITNINQLNNLIGDDAYRRSYPKEITVIATNEIGKKNLYRLLTLSHTKYIHREPRVTKELINLHREGLLIGSGSHDGPLFETTLNKTTEQAVEVAKFFDYIEIQPSDIASYLVADTRIDSQEIIDKTWKKIYAIGKKIGKKVVATGNVHYINEEDYIFHNVLLYHKVAGVDIRKREGRRGVERTGRHFRDTQKMKESFPWLGEAELEEIVVTNSRWVAEQCVFGISPVPNKLYPPKIEGSNEELTELATKKAKEIYGDNLPEYVQARLDKELNSIISNGFSVIYLISQKLVKNSNDNGYLVGSRGSVGSSFVATMTGITEVNPLKPHYIAKDSKWHVFFDHEELPSGYDLPTSLGELLVEKHVDPNNPLLEIGYSKHCIEYVINQVSKSLNLDIDETIQVMKNHKSNTCPISGKSGLLRDGQDIPFETFLGFKGDKIPDIDLNFSGKYQTKSHKYVEELFGERYVFRAGTIGTVADKKAFGYIASYGDENGYKWSKTKISRYASLLQGAKSTSGQHPGGILVVPDYMEPEDFTAVQHPAENPKAGVRTSHFDFHSIHDFILKLDILGHDDPTILRLLQDSTGIDPKTVEPNNKTALKLFTSPGEALGINMEDITASVGTLGVPEFGTEFVQQMIMDTKPKTFAELVKLSGLSHGTDVWIGNAQDLIKKGICTLSSVIDTRDNIMVFLEQKGLEPSRAFKIMEGVRKGKGITPEDINYMREFNVPEWYIESCLKIKYMFPKAHAAAYVLSAMRIANYKVFHPIDFYAAVLSVRYNDENIKDLNLEPSELRKMIAEYEKESRALKNKGEINPANKMKRTKDAMELVLEARVRGIEFAPVSLEQSHANNYTIKDGKLVPPFRSISGLGEKAAEGLYVEFRKEPFKSVEDIAARTSATTTNIEVLREFGCLSKIENTQYSLF